MMSENEYDENKQHVNIGVIGHIDSGRSTIIAAITTLLSSNKEIVSEKNDITENTFPICHVDLIGYYDYGIILVKAHNMPTVLEYKLEDMTFQNMIGLVEAQDKVTNIQDIDELCLTLFDDITDITDIESVLTSRIERKYLENNNSYKNIYKKSCNYKNRKKYGYVFRRK